MRPRLVALAVVLAWTLGAVEARAHFLFLRIGPMAEAGRTAEVYFSDRTEAGDPKFVDKIAGTKLWAQSKPGEFRPLTVHKGADRLRSLVPSSGGVVVVGACEYGVLARPGQTPFLLRYYPKALAGRPDDLNRLKSRGDLPLEIVARIDGDRVRLSVVRDGKPIPKAAFHAVDLDLNEEQFTAGPNGEATWSPKSPGSYAVYTRHDTKVSGEAGGTRYEEIRDFATLALDWPLVRSGADPEAVALFKKALANRAQWVDFPGFAAKVAGDFDGRPVAGKVTIDADGGVTSQGVDAAARSWVEGQVSSIIMLRRAESQGDPEPVLRFADDSDDHPLGRLLTFEGGRFASSYRIKDGRISVVNRNAGRSNMTITTLDNERNRDGKELPRSYVVQYWDAGSGDLRRVETVQDRWARVGEFDLPAAHTVTTASGAGLSVRSLTLSGHELARPGSGGRGR
jgi:hypothetical protein